MDAVSDLLLKPFLQQLDSRWVGHWHGRDPERENSHRRALYYSKGELFGQERFGLFLITPLEPREYISICCASGISSFRSPHHDALVQEQLLNIS